MKRFAAAVFLLAAVPFAGTVRHGMIDLDDAGYLQAKDVRAGLCAESVAWAFSNVDFGIWMPATWLVYMAGHDVSRAAASLAGTPERRWDMMYATLHGAMALVHGVNAVLLWALLMALMEERSGRKAWIAAGCALVWAVHPLRVESVAWLASLKDVLCQTGVLGGTWAWVSWRRRGGAWRYVASMACLLWALASKPSAMSFPVLVAALDFLALGGRAGRAPGMVRRLAPYLAPVAMCGVAGLVAQVAQAAAGATGFTAEIPLWYRLANALTSLGVYLIHTVWPVSLAPQCLMRWPGMPRMCVAGMAAGAAAIAWTAWRLRRHAGGGDMVLAGAVWFLAAVAPMLGIAGFGGHAFADRFTCIPSVGISIALAGMLAACAARPPYRIPMAAAVVALGALTWRQTGFWKDDRTLWTHVLEVDGDGNFMAHMSLGKWFYEREHETGLKEASAHFARAFELDPRHSMNMSLIYMFLLGETGERERLEKLYFDFFAWIRDRHGFTDSIDQKIAEGIYVLYGRRTATGERAKEIARELMDTGRRDIYQLWHYVYLAGRLTGDRSLEESGREGLLRLSDPNTGFDDTVRFRFLTDAWRKS